MEGLDYRGFQSRVQRDPGWYTTKSVVRPEGGKPLKLVAVSSLSPAAQERYWKEQAAQVVEDIMEEKTAGEPPWYESVDAAAYMREHPAEYAQAAERLTQLRAFMNLPWGERREACKALAAQYGTTERTIYNYVERIEEAQWCAQKRKKKGGQNCKETFPVLAICPKPRTKNTFPALTDELRALIENVWVDPGFAPNHPRMTTAAERVLQIAAQRHIRNLPNARQITSYIQYLKTIPEIEDARALAVLGRRDYMNRRGQKTLRDTGGLKVLEVVVGDEHTCDFFVMAKDPSGRAEAVRPVLCAWIDIKSRRMLGATLCRRANYDVLKESFLKMVYKEAKGVPQCVYIDNGKDYTAAAMTGKSKKQLRRHQGEEADSAVKGFYRLIGVKEIHVAIPYQPWSKGHVEREFGTLAEGFSKRFGSYVGTLTDSRTDAKVKKDIPELAKSGKLISIEEAQKQLEAYLEEYHARKHRGLADAGEPWQTPAEMFANGERYEYALPPFEYALELLKQDDVSTVRPTGIQKFNRRYQDPTLAVYIGRKVNVKYDPDDLSRLWVYDMDTHKRICVAELAESMRPVGEDPEKVAEHMRNQKRQYQRAQEKLWELRTPYEERIVGAAPKRRTKSMENLMIEGSGEPVQKLVRIPEDEEWRSDAEERRTRKAHDNIMFTRDCSAFFEWVNAEGGN